MRESESVLRIEPLRLDEPTETISDLVAEISASAATLGRALHPRTAANLADLVRLMNSYYSNLIEGHDTRPREIERALKGDLIGDRERRNLQLEAAADRLHVLPFRARDSRWTLARLGRKERNFEAGDRPPSRRGADSRGVRTRGSRANHRHAEAEGLLASLTSKGPVSFGNA